MSHRGVQAKPKPLPAFASRDEEAEFWDTHDVTDYALTMEPVDLKLDPPLSEPITLQIDIETMDKVRAHAAERDVPPDVLFYLWILERCDAERQLRGDVAPTAENGSDGTSAAG